MVIFLTLEFFINSGSSIVRQTPFGRPPALTIGLVALVVESVCASGDRTQTNSLHQNVPPHMTLGGTGVSPVFSNQAAAILSDAQLTNKPEGTPWILGSNGSTPLLSARSGHGRALLVRTERPLFRAFPGRSLVSSFHRWLQESVGAWKSRSLSQCLIRFR